MKIQHVPLDYIQVVWPQVERFFVRAIRHAQNEYTMEQVRGLVAYGQWRLIVATDKENTLRGAMAVNVYNRPNDRVAFIQVVGGKDIISPDSFEQLSALCAAWGATTIECAGRPSMVRLLEQVGMMPKYQILGKTLWQAADPQHPAKLPST